MPRDDRDQNFEKALARTLGSSSNAAHADADAAPPNDCLDAEILAAYHERLLDPEDMAQRKSHIASCERCQEILAQLESTDRIAVEADRDLLLDQMIVELPELELAGANQEPPVAVEAMAESATPVSPATEIVPLEEAAEDAVAPEPEFEIEHEPDLVAASAALPSLELARAASTQASLPVFAAVAAKPVPASATITFRSPRQDRPKMVRFVAIAAALAAGLILWFVYRDQTKQFDLAQNRTPSKLELPQQSRTAAPSPLADSKDATVTPQTSAPSAAALQNSVTPSAAQPQPSVAKTPTDNVSNALDDAQKTLDTAKAIEKKSRKDAAAAQSPTFTPVPRDESAATGALDFARASTSRAGSTTASGKVAPANQPSIPSPVRAVNNTAGDAANTIPSGIPATPPPARTKMNPGVVSEPATLSSSARTTTQLSASAQSGPQSETLSKPSNGRVVAALTPLSVPAPSGTTIWRIGQAGVIQRSTDSGVTWSIQPSGVVTDLIAGSAYSDQVCWLVGRNGTVLRTTNGGATWRKLTSPSNVDLLGVFSINADSATVTDAAGRAFETTTAGAHWSRTQLQQ